MFPCTHSPFKLAAVLASLLSSTTCHALSPLAPYDAARAAVTSVFSFSRQPAIAAQHTCPGCIWSRRRATRLPRCPPKRAAAAQQPHARAAQQSWSGAHAPCHTPLGPMCTVLWQSEQSPARQVRKRLSGAHPSDKPLCAWHPTAMLVSRYAAELRIAGQGTQQHPDILLWAVVSTATSGQ